MSKPIHLQLQSEELLRNIQLVRKLHESKAEECLYKDLQNLLKWLQAELRHLAPSLKDWARPWLDLGSDASSINIEAHQSWCYKGQSAVCLYFSIFPENGVSDGWSPNVGVWVNPDWKHHDELFAHLGSYRPAGFVSTSDTGETNVAEPFWKVLSLEDFQHADGFNLDAFVGQVIGAFEELAPLRQVIDQFLAERHDEVGLVPRLRKALVLDTETWGPGNPKEDEIVEIGLILIAYDAHSGEVAGILDEYEGLRDPGHAVSVKPSAKITRKMVAGKQLDKARIENFISQADTIISHNARGFDKPRFERLFPASKQKRWVCSYQDLPWSAMGFDGAKLEDLCARHGVANRNPHRALPDAEALLSLLAKGKDGAISYFAGLMAPTTNRESRTKAASAGK